MRRAVFKFEGNSLGVTASGSDFPKFKEFFGNDDRGFGYIRIQVGWCRACGVRNSYSCAFPKRRLFPSPVGRARKRLPIFARAAPFFAKCRGLL